jgi:carbon storage regulator
MLVLSRKPGQKLQIGDQITITVLEVHGKVLRLGIEAPTDVRILRAELEDWQSKSKVVARRTKPVMAVAS